MKMMKTKQNGKIYYGRCHCHFKENHPLLFMLEKIDDWTLSDAYIFERDYMDNEMICTYKTGVLHGPIEVFNEYGWLILSGNFKEGYAEGKWKIYHWESLADNFIESEWKKGEPISPDFFDDEFLYLSHYFHGPEVLTKHKDGKSWNISHDIWGYWSANAAPLPTFNVTYKIKASRLIERKIIQYAYWDEEETEISIESFDKNGMLSEVKLHELIKKHSAYEEPLRFKDWTRYDDDNSAEVLMVRTIELLKATEVKGKYEDEYLEDEHVGFGYGFKLHNSGPTLKEMCYFAWGEPYGVSIYFGEDNKINKLKWKGDKVIWDIENGLNDDFVNFAKCKRKNINTIVQNREPPFESPAHQWHYFHFGSKRLSEYNLDISKSRRPL